MEKWKRRKQDNRNNGTDMCKCMCRVMLTNPVMAIMSTGRVRECSLDGVDVGRLYNFRDVFIPVTDRSWMK